MKFLFSMNVPVHDFAGGIGGADVETAGHFMSSIPLQFP